MLHCGPHDAGGSFSVYSELPHQSEKGSADSEFSQQRSSVKPVAPEKSSSY